MANDKKSVDDCEIVIEVDHPTNSNVWFYPHGRRVLRSRFLLSRANPGGKVPSSHLACSEIPGTLIGLNVKERFGVVHDPITDTEHETVREAIKRAKKSTSGQRVGFTEVHAEHPDLEELQLNRWLYWMRRLLDSKHARAVKGQRQLPKCDEIKKKLGDDTATPNMFGVSSDYYRSRQEIEDRRKQEKLALTQKPS